jgi:hypothetical protein
MDITKSAGNHAKEIEMCVHGVHSLKTEEVSEVEVAIEKAFSAKPEPRPEDVRNASTKVGDGATLASLELERQEERRLRALT